MKIIKGDNVLAEKTTDNSMSSYGQPVWTIFDQNPENGKAIWEDEDNRQEIEILNCIHGWLIVKQSDGLISAIIWSDGTYYANLLLYNDKPVKKYNPKLQYWVKGTVQMNGYGGILSINENML